MVRDLAVRAASEALDRGNGSLVCGAPAGAEPRGGSYAGRRRGRGDGGQRLAAGAGAQRQVPHLHEAGAADQGPRGVRARDSKAMQ